MFGSKLNSIESTSVLMAMRASLGLGLSPQEAIELQAESQSGKIGKVLSTVSFLVNKKEKKLADTLYRFGILSLEEKYVLENSGNRTKETINDIIDMREMKGRFDKTLLSMIWFPIVSVIIGATLVLMLYPKFIGPYHSLLKMAEYKGVTMSDKVGFLCIDHFELLQPFLFGYIAIVLILWYPRNKGFVRYSIDYGILNTLYGIFKEVFPKSQEKHITGQESRFWHKKAGHREPGFQC